MEISMGSLMVLGLVLTITALIVFLLLCPKAMKLQLLLLFVILASIAGVVWGALMLIDRSSHNNWPGVVLFVSCLTILSLNALMGKRLFCGPSSPKKPDKDKPSDA